MFGVAPVVLSGHAGGRDMATLRWSVIVGLLAVGACNTTAPPGPQQTPVGGPPAVALLPPDTVEPGGAGPQYPGAGFRVHEWGTNTIVVGSDGSMQRGLQHEEEDLPSFVNDRRREEL